MLAAFVTPRKVLDEQVVPYLTDQEAACADTPLMPGSGRWTRAGRPAGSARRGQVEE